jgi:hypothetical protein
MSKNISRKAWDKIAKDYSKLIVPNRPSINDCRIYGEMVFETLKGVKRPKILVMGSTPEIRRMLYGLEALQDAEVFCVDVSENMYVAMSGFIFNSPHFNETFLKRSWLKTGFKEDFFDLVIGDEVICNVPTNLHEKLFAEISRILKKEGLWITRHNVFLEKDKQNSIKKIMSSLGSKLLKGAIDFQYAENLLFLEIFYHYSSVNHTNNSLNSHLRLVKEEYRRSFHNHRLKKVVKELIYIHEKNFGALLNEYNWYVLSKKESLMELKKYFIVKKEKFANDYPTVKNSPIYLLKKK